MLISHNRKHSITGSADIRTPTHHLTVNAATCYLILFIFLCLFFFFFFLPANTRAPGRRIGLFFHKNIPASPSTWHIIRLLRTRFHSVRVSSIHTERRRLSCELASATSSCGWEKRCRVKYRLHMIIGRTHCNHKAKYLRALKINDGLLTVRGIWPTSALSPRGS